MSGRNGFQTSGYGGYGGPGGGDGGGASLRRRNMDNPTPAPTMSRRQRMAFSGNEQSTQANVVKKLDFMFPKVDSEFTMKTEGGGTFTLVAYCLILVLVLAEGLSWWSQNTETVETISVDTSLGRRMRVNMNITFPALACEDLHVDVMDVSGDLQLDIVDTMVKQRLSKRGRPIGKEVLEAEANKHQKRKIEKEALLNKDLPDDYCGPCFGAHEEEGQCCNTCDDLLEAYKKKKWRTDVILYTSEQCMREGRDKMEPKKLKKGEGCNLSGYFLVNRVAGNFHIAMGEATERDGRLIHTFNPDDTPNYNVSHVIHELSFGTSGAKIGFGEEPQKTLNGVAKIVTHKHGTTGLFQYFLKIVPTSYYTRRGSRLSSNSYFFTERFRPLMKEYLPEIDVPEDDEADDVDDIGDRKVDVNAGHAHKDKQDYHDIRNAVLPGVFFIYEIYPFEVQISKNRIPFTHLIIRLMATVGGVLTMFRLADSLIFSSKGSKGSSLISR